MKKVLFLLILIVFLTSCTSLQPNLTENKLFCSSDNDCICGGIDKETNSCFIGNINYFEKNVDKTKDCPDFCTGIANMFETKCVNNQCKNVKKQQTNPPTTETKIQSCQSNSDCIKSGCSGIFCMPKSKQESGFSTCEWQEYYKCYENQNCICKNNKCNWDNEESLNSCMKAEVKKYL